MNRPTGIKHDYKPQATSGSRNRSPGVRIPGFLRRLAHRPTHHQLVGLAGAAMGAAILITSLNAFSGPDRGAYPLTDDRRLVSLPLPAVSLAGPMALDPQPPRAENGRTLEVRPGESLARLFDRNDLDRGDLHAIMELGGETTSLARLMPGESLRVRSDEEGNVLALSRRLDEDRILHVQRDGDRFEQRIETLPTQRRVQIANGRIDRSLYQDARDAGLSDNLIMNLASIFQWDIDFVLDIRRGDEFVVIYEELHRDGDKLRDGNILAAEIINRGDRIQAVRYTDPSGHTDYYAPNGDSMRRTFLRAPLDYMRISSGFNPNRRHPVLNRIRAHRGVDYAAPQGTPIRAAGEGRIVRRGRRGGFGNAVQIQHGERYSTLYAHMASFARGHRVGSRVEQGEVIGYVGQSGLATGPHLHYEFLVDGVHRNPVTVDFPSADPVAAEYREHFASSTAPLIAHLDLLEPDERLAQRSE